MSIVFYSARMSSAAPVAAMLHELEVPHEHVRFDLSEKKHKRPEFLKLNPNGRVPTLVVDGTPMFEALAIQQWLADRYGVEKNLWPAASDPKRLEALSWTTWAYVTYGSVMNRLQLAATEWSPAELRHEAHAKAALAEAQELLAVLDARLAEQGGYVLGSTFSLADLLLASVIGYGAFLGGDVAPHPHVQAWLGRCRERPSLADDWG